MKINITVLLLLSISHLSFAQKENNIWAFGNLSGINFNTSPPSIYRTAIFTAESCASICDKDGNLLFYSNGETVWDKTHTVMPNGSGLSGNMSTTMGVALVSIPENPGLYFIFTLEAIEYTTNKYLKYSMIDMSLNSGKGDIVSGAKDIILAEQMSEKIIVSAACNAVWVITHHSDSAIFYAYKITNTTIPPPVISPTSGISSKDTYNGGEMKISPDYKKIVIANHVGGSKIELLDFDNRSGKVSGYIPIDTLIYTYSMEFSPDGSKLYCTNTRPGMYKFYQYDLSLLPDVARVRASRYNVADSIACVLRGPNGKLYIKQDIGTNSRINYPNLAGAACGFDYQPAELQDIRRGRWRLGNNTATAYSTGGNMYTSAEDTSICENSVYTYHTKHASHTSYRWNDGDTSQIRTFKSMGKYWLVSQKDCDMYIDTLTIKYIPRNLIGSRKDTTVCFEKKITLESPRNSDQYRWNDANTSKHNEFYGDGIKWVISFNNEGCTGYIDSFKINFIDFTFKISDTAICKNEEILLDATTPSANNYLWSDGSTGKTLAVNNTGQYWVEVSEASCTKRQEIKVSQRDFNFDLGADQTLCEGKTLLLNVGIKDASYVWQDASTNQTFEVSEDGVYRVKATSGACIAEDSIRVKFAKCSGCIIIPNAFTPNADGKNDRFKAILNCPALHYSLFIFNRYGQKIYSTQNASDSWDGTFNNQEQEIGTYYYLIKVRFDYPRAEEEMYKGDITLIR